MKRRQIATGFDCEPLKNGTVLIEFFGDDGKTFNTQIVTRDLIQDMPVVAILTEVFIEKGADAVQELMSRLGGEVPPRRATVTDLHIE